MPVLRLTSRFSRTIDENLQTRQPLSQLSRTIGSARASADGCVVFFCSSAGEYEQAKPIIDQLQTSKVESKLYIHIFFFSKSGYDYAMARGETIPFTLAPIDSLWNWGWLFSALQPQATIVVRHELWPAFLETARKWGALILVNASYSTAANTRSKLSRRMSRRLSQQALLSYFDTIFTVDRQSARDLHEDLNIKEHQLIVAGETKFDRVMTRALNTKGKSQLIIELSNLLQKSQNQKCLILGSTYLEDLELTLRSLRRNNLRERIKLIIAPHNTDRQTISQIEDRVISEGYLPLLASHINLESSHQADLPTQSRYHQDTVVFIIDSIGYLAEIYSLGDAAWVGGGLTNKVHNTLEPACHGLRLASGPKISNSFEAKLLKEKGLLAICRDPKEQAAWLNSVCETSKDDYGASTINTVQQLTGAASAITDFIRPLIQSRPNSDTGLRPYTKIQEAERHEKNGNPKQ